MHTVCTYEHSVPIRQHGPCRDGGSCINTMVIDKSASHSTMRICDSTQNIFKTIVEFCFSIQPSPVSLVHNHWRVKDNVTRGSQRLHCFWWAVFLLYIRKYHKTKRQIPFTSSFFNKGFTCRSMQYLSSLHTRSIGLTSVLLTGVGHQLIPWCSYNFFVFLLVCFRSLSCINR